MKHYQQFVNHTQIKSVHCAKTTILKIRNHCNLKHFKNKWSVVTISYSIIISTVKTEKVNLSGMHTVKSSKTKIQVQSWIHKLVMVCTMQLQL